MQTYPHERKTERDQAAMNTVCPLMSTDGVDIDDCKRYLEDRGLSWDRAEANGWYLSRISGDREYNLQSRPNWSGKKCRTS